MAARIARLKRRAEFVRVAGARRKWVMPGLILQAAQNREADPAHGEYRVGFTASRKVGMAVTRNRARRRLRAVADKVMPERARAGQDYVIVARRGTLARRFDDLVGDLESALEHIGERHTDSRRTHRGATR